MRRIFMAILGCLCVINVSTQADVLLNDGLVHDINYEISESVYVHHNDSDYSSTTVNVYDNAVINGNMYLYDRSYLNMTGGELNGELRVDGFSVASLMGGYVDSCNIWGNSTVAISGNTQILYLNALGDNTVTVGDNVSILGYFSILESLSTTINGGEFSGDFSCSSDVFEISGGTFHCDVNVGVGTGTISGGTFEDELTLAGDLLVSGGSFEGDIYISSLGEITFEGEGFAINGISLEYGTLIEDSDLDEFMGYENGFYTGVLTGTLGDGTDICQSILLHDLSEYEIDCGSMYFIPEPASMWLLLLGGGWLVRRKRR